ncbi:MAG: hypothetical protein BA863_01490 [Desulfovibrio sp. S3730MH75]|nr:MAG: hypothetical protein BA863_01490 [Desulfovibrio sp. S3730MH75]
MRFYIHVTILAFFLFFATQIVFAGPLRITSENYPPYSYKFAGHAEGFVSNIVNIIRGQLGEEHTEIIFFPWARAYQNLQNGLTDVLYPMALTVEREKLFKFVGPVFRDNIYFYRKKGSNVSFKTIEDAKKNVRIAVTRDDVYHHVLIEKGFTNLDVSPSQKLDFFKLLKGRVDFVPMGELAIHGFLKKYSDLDDSMFEKVGPVLFSADTYIAFASHVPDEVVQRWQGALDEIKGNGVYQFIIDYYFEQHKD